MMQLNAEDKELIKEARQIITKNYDEKDFNHTVGAALRSKSGNIYLGVNVYSLHGACAEQIALGNAITHGEREFVSIVAVRGPQGEEIIPPCGNCCQILSDYASECEVILSDIDDGIKVKSKELLPYAYKVVY